MEAKEETMKFFEPGHGAPAPKHPTESGERTPEMERQQAAAIEKEETAAKNLKHKLQRPEEAMLRPRRKRYQSEPSPSMGADAREAIKEAEAEEEAERENVDAVPAGGVPAVIIFDWDDTLFPTRHVTEVVKALHPKDGPLPSESPYHPDLKVDIHTDTVTANMEAKEETMKFFEPGHGAPAPKHPTESGERTPEMERQRAAAIEKVATAARKLKHKLQMEEQAMLRRRRKRHQSEPSPSMGADAREAIKEAEAEEEAERENVDAVPAGGVPAVIIFDWDDTLFPTRHVTEVVKALHPKDGPLPSESPYHPDLKAHAQIVESILLSAREVVGRVSIVTLARRPWVENSAAWYLPGVDFEKLFQELEIEIFYAREHITRPHIYNAQLEEGVDMFVIAKRNAMLKCLRKLYGPSTKTMHVISVGDSTVEHLAAKEVLWCCPQEAGSYCKTIKLVSDPSVQNLTEELQVLASWLQQIVACEKDFDISFESEDFNDNIMDTLDAAGPTPKGPGSNRP